MSEWKGEERKMERPGEKEVDGARAKVRLILVNLLSFHLLSTRKTIGTGSANVYYLLITIINCFLY